MADIFNILLSNIINIILIIFIFYRIYHYFYGPKDTEKTTPLSWIGKIFALITIFIIGGTISCGGNFLLMMTGIFGQGEKSLANGFIFWFFELGIVLLYAIWRVYLKKSTSNPESPVEQFSDNEKPTESIPSETNELMTSISQIDISNIASITFLPTDGQGFTIKTPNIKRLTIYITTKLKKNIFEREELRKAFDHVAHHISSDLSKTDFNLIQGKINEFVKRGGEVKINKI